MIFQHLPFSLFTLYILLPIIKSKQMQFCKKTNIFHLVSLQTNLYLSREFVYKESLQSFLRNIQNQNFSVKVETFLNSFWMNLIRSWVDGHSISRGGTFNNLFHWELALTIEFRYQMKMKLIKKIFEKQECLCCPFKRLFLGFMNVCLPKDEIKVWQIKMKLVK